MRRANDNGVRNDMMSVALWLVIIGAGIGAYSYFGYPLLLLLLRAGRPRRKDRAAPPEWPVISITVPAYNEAATIGPTLDRLLDLDYPADRRQILVVSDASTDGTDDVVAGYAARGIELLRMPTRGGKTAAENAACTLLRGDIVVNTDASVRIERHALKPLVACFNDPKVGVASGRDISVARMDDTANVGESGYVGYEMWIRGLETDVSGIVGASGCFYAIRARLHQSLVPAALSRDFAAALIARDQGFRAVSVHDAVCYVPRTAQLHSEYRRKVRTMARGMETLYYRRGALNPLRDPIFAWMLFSHKLCRWATPWAFALVAVGLAILALDYPLARWAFAAGLLVLVLAGIGWTWPPDRPLPRLVSVPAYAVAGSVAAMHASLKALRGELNPIWEPTRRKAVDTA